MKTNLQVIVLALLALLPPAFPADGDEFPVSANFCAEFSFVQEGESGLFIFDPGGNKWQVTSLLWSAAGPAFAPRASSATIVAVAVDGAFATNTVTKTLTLTVSGALFSPGCWEDFDLTDHQFFAMTGTGVVS